MRILRQPASSARTRATAGAVTMAVAVITAAVLAFTVVGTSAWTPALAVPVLETGMEDAVTLAESMDARGHGRGRRTRYRPDRWTREAALTAAAATIAGGVFLTAAWTGHGGLHPVTAPLAWPRVEPALLGVIGLLAVPGLRSSEPPP